MPPAHTRANAASRWFRLWWAHALALGILAVALALGPAAAGGYGLAHDQADQQLVGEYAIDYLRGKEEVVLDYPVPMRYYGVAFEVVVRGVQRALGLTDSHDVFLGRYLLTHCFFLIGAFACYLLAHRLFGSRAVALLALLFFLCHPRIHAHSFFNSKDVPFLSMVVIGLLLAHWALRRGGLGAFAVLGAWLGLACSMRPMGFLLVGLVLLARCADLCAASGRERARVLASAGVLAALAVAAFFAGLPYLWGDPVARLGEWLALMADHTMVERSLFFGEVIATSQRPLAYVPVWIGITTPPFVIVLALLGCVALCARLAAEPRAVLADDGMRFAVLLAAFVLVTVVAVTFWVGNIYNGWRHLYFLYGPLCLGAAGGLAWLRGNAGRRLARLGVVVAALGVVPPVTWAARLHPHEHVYFNLLVDRKTPERLRTLFDMDYWAVPFKEALEVLLAAVPGQVPVTGPIAQSIDVLPPEQRRRVVRSSDFAAYFATDYRYWWGHGVVEGPTYVRPLHVRRVFGSTLYALARLEAATTPGSRYRADYLAALSSPPVAVGPFSVHWQDEALTYLRTDCAPAEVEREWFTADGWQPEGRFFLHVLGDKNDPADLGRYRHNEDFQFRHRGVVFREGASRVCMARVSLRGFDVDAIVTGQVDAGFKPVWSRTIGRADADLLAETLARVRTMTPRARGGFDVHVDEGGLAYVKENCAPEDHALRFFLHVVPFDPGALPRTVARHGFVNRDFAFATHGAVLDGACVARVRLPPFPIRAVRTGQVAAGGGDERWRVDVDLTRREGRLP